MCYVALCVDQQSGMPCRVLLADVLMLSGLGPQPDADLCRSSSCWTAAHSSTARGQSCNILHLKDEATSSFLHRRRHIQCVRLTAFQSSLQQCKCCLSLEQLHPQCTRNYTCMLASVRLLDAADYARINCFPFAERDRHVCIEKRNMCCFGGLSDAWLTPFLRDKLITVNPMLQALRSLRGIGSYFVPVDLPPLLESLEYSAEPHPVFGGWGGRPPRFAAEKLEAAAKAVCGLGNLRWLVVKQCVETPLPPSFVAQLVAQLPTTLQVGWQWPSLLIVWLAWRHSCMRWCLLSVVFASAMVHSWADERCMHACPAIPIARRASVACRSLTRLMALSKKGRQGTLFSWIRLLLGCRRLPSRTACWLIPVLVKSRRAPGGGVWCQIICRWRSGSASTKRCSADHGGFMRHSSCKPSPGCCSRDRMTIT